MGAWPYPPWLVSCNERSVFVPEWTTPQLSSICLTLSPLVSLMYRAKCINPRVNNYPKFMVVGYNVVWHCMKKSWYGMGAYYRWVLSTDGCEAIVYLLYAYCIQVLSQSAPMRSQNGPKGGVGSQNGPVWSNVLGSTLSHMFWPALKQTALHCASAL